MKTIDEMIEFVYKLSRHSSGTCRFGALATLEYAYGIPYAELADKMRAYEKAEHRAANEARRLANRDIGVKE